MDIQWADGAIKLVKYNLQQSIYMYLIDMINIIHTLTHVPTYKNVSDIPNVFLPFFF